jgi:fatty acid desaturase
MTRRFIFTLVLFACLAVGLIGVAYPIYVIRPFRHQGAGELAVALAVTRFRPAITVVAAIAAVLAAIGYWCAGARRWKRVLTAAGAGLVVVLAFLARVNVYELMFHPLVHPSFTAANEVKLDGAEKVVAVRVGGKARAYPIRSMSYHHVVNDVVGGTAIVATY